MIVKCSSNLSAMIVASLALAISQAERCQAETVQEALNAPQSYPSETYDRLIAIGAEGVPDMCEQLFEYKYPAEIVRALTKVGDSRAAEPLAKFLQSLRPFSGNRSPKVSRRHVIEALSVVGGEGQRALLTSIMRSTSSHIETRLASAAALRSIGGNEVREEAEEFIRDVYEHRDQYINPANNGSLDPEVLDIAILSLKNDWAEAIITDKLTGYVPPHVSLFLLKRLGSFQSNDLQIALQNMVENEGEEVVVRLAVVETLIEAPWRPAKSDLTSYLDALEPLCKNPPYSTKYEILRAKLKLINGRK